MSTEMLQRWLLDAELSLAPPSSSTPAHRFSSSGSDNSAPGNFCSVKGGLAAALDVGDRKRKREWDTRKSENRAIYSIKDINDAFVIPHVKSEDDTMVQLNSHAPLPRGWEECLDLQSGQIYYANWNTQATTVNDPRMNLESQKSSATACCHSKTRKENLFRRGPQQLSTARHGKADRISFSSNLELPTFSSPLDLDLNLVSCEKSLDQTESRDFRVFKEVEPAMGSSISSIINDETNCSISYATMVAVPCMHCHMFVMLSRASPHCPNCRSLCSLDQSCLSPVPAEKTRETLKLLDIEKPLNSLLSDVKGGQQMLRD